MENNNCTYIPKCLNAGDIQKVLKLSRAGVYTLMRREDFPTIRIGKRMLVPEDKFVEWLHKQSERGGGF